MSIKATINSIPKTRISINNQNRESVRTVAVGSTSRYDELRKLKDVNASSLIDGYTVVYDEGSDKFVVEELPKINGGNF